MSNTPKPNLRYDHGFAVIRTDEFESRVVKVMHDSDLTEKEVERLNRINADKGVTYRSQITRIERKQVDLL